MVYGLTYTIILLFPILTVIFLCVIPAISYSKRRKFQNELNKKVLEQVEKDISFKISRVFRLNDNATDTSSDESKKMVLVDNDNKKIIFIDYDKCSYYKFDFCDIINYELYENGNTLINGAGAGMFGVGMFASAATQNCKELRLIIRLKKYNVSQIKYDIVSETALNTGVGKSTRCYQRCVSSLQEFISFIEVIKSENEKKK